MYQPAALLSLLLLSILVLLQITSIKSKKNHVLYNLKKCISIIMTISILAAMAPEKAQIGAPFHKYGQPKIAFFGCNYQISLTTARFCSEDRSFEWCYCNNFDAFATIAHCYQIGHEKQVDSLLDMCNNYSNKTYTKDLLKKADEYYTNHAKTIDEIPDFLPFKLVDFPIKLNESEIHIFENAYEQFLGNYDRSIDYGFYLIQYWVIIFSIVSIGNWSKLLTPKLQPRGRLSNWFRQHISLPATGSNKKTNEFPILKIFDMLVPTRAETLILTVFAVLCLYFMTVNIFYTPGDPLFANKSNALLRYYAVRASMLSSSLMPLLILFGGRNNILQYITRWDYSTFITLHRWVSRIIVFMVLIHSTFYAAYIKHRKLPHGIQPYIYFGVAATYAGLVILIQGLLVLRRKWYEMFLLLHIILAAIFIFGAWKHVEDLYCVWFYYTSAAIWAFDRVIRVLRIFEFGFPMADVYLLSDETLKIVARKPKEWKAIPGGHAFIHFLKPSCFWQSHPFTYTADDYNIILFIKVKKGVTRQLYNYLNTHTEKKTKVRVAIEGSYGETTPASKYNSAVFVAGGNGIPGIFAEAVDLLKYENQQSIKLYWVVREYKSLLWFYEELTNLRNTKIETTIYITRPNLTLDEADFNSRSKKINSLNTETTPFANTQTKTKYDSIESDNNIIADIKKELSHIKIIESRPVVEKLVQINIDESIGSTCFVTCGAPAMVDELRRSVAGNLNYNENKRVDYFEQLQVWA